MLNIFTIWLQFHKCRITCVYYCNTRIFGCLYVTITSFRLPLQSVHDRSAYIWLLSYKSHEQKKNYTTYNGNQADGTRDVKW